MARDGAVAHRGGAEMLAEFGVAQLAVWLMTVGVVVGIPVAIIALVFRLG